MKGLVGFFPNQVFFTMREKKIGQSQEIEVIVVYLFK